MRRKGFGFLKQILRFLNFQNNFLFSHIPTIALNRAERRGLGDSGDAALTMIESRAMDASSCCLAFLTREREGGEILGRRDDSFCVEFEDIEELPVLPVLAVLPVVTEELMGAFW